MKKFSLFLSLMCCFCLYAWAGEASLKAAPAAAPIVEHVNGVKAVSADFVPGTVVTDAASISEGMGYVLRSVRGFVLRTFLFSHRKIKIWREICKDKR